MKPSIIDHAAAKLQATKMNRVVTIAVAISMLAQIPNFLRWSLWITIPVVLFHGSCWFFFHRQLQNLVRKVDAQAIREVMES